MEFEKEMLMTSFERAKYEEGGKDVLEKARANMINLFREENKTDEEIDEILVKLGYVSIPV